jgi:predicted nucleotidyltransferase
MTDLQPQFDFDRIDRRTKKITPALIAAIRERIVEHLRPERIILFGSQASGKAARGSDIDLLIVLDDHHPLAPLKRRDRFGELLELFRYRSFGLDAIILTEAEVKKIRDDNEGEWDLVLEVLEEGKKLYARSQKAEAQRTHSPANTRMVSQS